MNNKNAQYTDTRTLDPIVARLAALARRKHYYCEDNWYSCPKATDGCANDGEGTECNCGADRINAAVDEILAELTRGEGVTDEKHIAISV